MIPSTLPLARRQQRILVVDDAASTRAFLAFHLQEAGYRVWCAASRPEALQLVEQRGTPNLVVLDLHLNNLPEPLQARWHTQLGALPCLWLADATHATGSANSAGLLRKPLEIRQLLAVVQQRLPDPEGSWQAQPEVQVDGRLRVNFAACYALLDGQEVALSVAESTLLEQLYLHRGEVLSPAFLCDKIRCADPTARKLIPTYVYYLRQKLEYHQAHRRYIRNIPGQGYLMPSVFVDRQPPVPLVIPRKQRQRQKITGISPIKRLEKSFNR